MRESSAVIYATAAFAPLVLFIGVPFSSGDSFSTLALLTVAATWLTSALFIVYAFRSPTVPPAKRGLWVAVIVFGNIVALPFFWFWYVWQPSRLSHT
jgi:hypothetical protein